MCSRGLTCKTCFEKKKDGNTARLHCVSFYILFHLVSARVVARLRLGHCGVNGFLSRHVLSSFDECPRCLFLTDEPVCETVAHRLSCPSLGPPVGVLHAELDRVVNGWAGNFLNALSIKLPLDVQIPISNALVTFARDTTDMGII